MKAILLSCGAVLVSLAFMGCSAEGSSADTNLPTAPDPSESGKKSPAKSPSNTEDNGHYTVPTPADPTPVDPGATPDPTKDPATPPDPNQTPTPPAGSQTSTCTATNGANKSVTTFVFTLDNGSLKFSTMTVAMTNKDARNKNDVDVFITPQGGSETKSFNSGDILPNAKTTEVPLPTSFSPKPGAKIRIETNFDQAFSDPSASCTIQF